MGLLSAMITWVVGMTSCNDEDNSAPNATLNAPVLVQSEEVIDIPITLAFSWEPVDQATKYLYSLQKTDTQDLLAQGSTDDLNVSFTYSKETDLLYNTSYTFSVQAVNDEKVSETTSTEIMTGNAPIAISMDELTYRSAMLHSVPEDNNMKYQFANIPIEKYTPYASDMEFIETYDFGYYKAYSQMLPVPWYTVMEMLSRTGSYDYHTTILMPDTDYLLYAYGVDFDSDNPDDPVKITTPLIKLPYTTPAWKATSNCTFNIEIAGQELVNLYGETRVNVLANITPSDDAERYYVCFYETALLDRDNLTNFAISAVLNAEQYNGVTDWETTAYAKSGKQTVSGAAQNFYLSPGTSCMVLVFGVDSNGMVTTEVSSIEFESIAANTSTTIKKVASNTLPESTCPTMNEGMNISRLGVDNE